MTRSGVRNGAEAREGRRYAMNLFASKVRVEQAECNDAKCNESKLNVVERSDLRKRRRRFLIFDGPPPKKL